MASDKRSVQVRHPMPHDLVGRSFHVAGVGTGFEGTVAWRMVASDGEAISSGGVQGGGMGVMGEFAFSVELTGDQVPSGDVWIELQVYGDNPGLPDEGPDPGFDVNSVPLTLGFRLVDGYWGFVLHEVKAGDTLTRIAQDQAFGTTNVSAIFRANRDLLSNPDLIHPGQILRVPLGS